jgi:hypothetical protein
MWATYRNVWRHPSKVIFYCCTLTSRAMKIITHAGA